MEFLEQTVSVVESTPTPLRRTFSSILAEFPWFTSRIVGIPAPISQEDVAEQGYQSFAKALNNFENNLFKFERNDDSVSLLRLLGVALPEEQGSQATNSIISKHENMLSVTDYQIIGSLLAAYRFYEILSLLSGKAERIPVEKTWLTTYLPPVNKTSNDLPYYNQLFSWTTLIREFRELINQTTLPPLPRKKYSNPMLSLLNMVKTTSTDAKFSAVSENFLLMALHMAALKHIPFKHGMLPDFPSSSYFFENTTSGSSEYQEFMTAYNELMQKERPGNQYTPAPIAFRNSFHLSVLISPLYLLVKSSLHNKSFNRRTIIDFCSRLGPHKPESIRRAEDIIWKSLLELSEGNSDIVSVLTALEQSLGSCGLESELESPEDAEWFRIRPSAPYLRVDKNTLIISHDTPPMPPQNKNLTSDPLKGPLFIPKEFLFQETLSLRPSSSPSIHENRIDIDSESNTIGRTLKNIHPLPPDDEECLVAAENVPATLPITPPTSDSSDRHDHIPIDYSMNPHTCPEISVSESLTPQGSVIQSQEWPGQANAEMSPVEKQGITSLFDLNTSSTLNQDVMRAPDRNSCQSSITKPLPDDMSCVTDNMSMHAVRVLRTRGTASSAALSLSFPLSVTSKSKQCKKPTKNNKHPVRTLNEEKQNSYKAGGTSAVRAPKRPASSSVPFESDLGTVSNPISITKLRSIFDPPSSHDYVEEERIPLPPVTTTVQTPCDNEYTVFDSMGDTFTFRPSFHYKRYEQRFDQFMKSAAETQKDGKPFHVSSPHSSIISTHTYEDWMSMTPSQRSEKISSKNVVVSNWPLDEPISFDQEGLRKVAGISCRRISIQDFSIPVEESSSSITVSGLVSDIWENRGPGGKILNALDLPMFEGDTKLKEHTSDLHAWDITRGVHQIHQKEKYPTEEMRWALVGLKNTITFVHTDCDGLSTDVHVLCGGKVWGFLREYDANRVASTEFFIHKNFALDEVSPEAPYNFEVISLRPGDRLFMLAGQPHFVYGYEDTMCYGGHFYDTHQMQKTFHGLINTFLLQQFLTNTTHPTRVFLRRMVIFYHMGLIENQVKQDDPAAPHLPRFKTMTGLMDLVCACVLVILGNVLDHRTYNAPNEDEFEEDSDNVVGEILLDSEINGIQVSERMATCYARGVALHIMEWIRQCAGVLDPNGNPIEDFPTYFLEKTLLSLAHCSKEIVDERLIESSPFTPEQLIDQISNIRTVYKPSWILPSDVDTSFWGLEDVNSYEVKWSSQTNAWEGGDTAFLEAGTTPFDRKFFHAQRNRQEYEKMLLLPHIQDWNDGAARPLKRTRNV